MHQIIYLVTDLFKIPWYLQNDETLIDIMDIKQTDAEAQGRRQQTNPHSVKSDWCQGPTEFWMEIYLLAVASWLPHQFP